MERIDKTWADHPQKSVQLCGLVLGAAASIDGLHTYDIDFTSSLSLAGKNDYPQTLLNCTGSSASSSSPTLSDLLLFATDDSSKFSHSTSSSEGTISPTDLILSSPLLREEYFTQPAILPRSPQPHYAPISPISPKSVTHAITPAPKAETVDADSISARTRRRTVTKSSAPSKESAKSATTSNQNNSKPMTARDCKRRQMHNASAMRSRIRLNETLDKMWNTIPAERRRKRLVEALDGQDPMHDIVDEEEERIGRADKVEFGIEYIEFLMQQVKQLEERLERGD